MPHPAPWHCFTATLATALALGLTLVAPATSRADIPTANPESADGILHFPADANMVIVTDHGAIPDDEGDDTAALQQSIEAALSVWPKKFVYLPKGTYLVSDSLMSRIMAKRDATKGSGWVSHMVLIGESRDATVIRLKDHAPGFADPAKPKAVIVTGSEADNPNPAGGGNRAFAHRIINLTVHTGNGNPGAIGIDFITSNSGCVSDVTVRSGDGTGSAGIAMNRNWPGPGLVRNVSVEGFDYGVQMLNHFQYGMTFEHLTLRKQNKAGFQVEKNCAFIRGLRSENNVPAFVANNASVVLIDSQLTPNPLAGVLAPGQGVAIQGDGQLFARNVTTSGYAQAIAWQSKDRQTIKGGHVQEFTSHPAISFYGTEEAKRLAPRSLNLPILETPTFHDNDMTHWVKVQGRSAEALQAAIDATIDTDKTTVYLPNLSDDKGYVTLDKTVIVRGNVRAIVSCGSEIKSTKAFAESGQPAFVIQDGPGPIVIQGFRKLEGKIQQNSTRPLAVRQTMIANPAGFNHPTSTANVYNTEQGTGPIFLEDTVAEVTLNPGGTLFARQLNCEFGIDPVLENTGGTLWVLGFKDEMGLPFNEVLQTGPKSKTEILGLFHYVLGKHGQGDIPVIINDQGQLSLFFAFNGNNVNTLFMRQRLNDNDPWQDIPSKTLPRRFPLLVSQP